MTRSHFETTTSTQDEARAAAGRGAEEWSVFTADAQTAGRGRQGRPWIAPPGSALLASVLLRPSIAPPSLPPLSLVVGLAVADALARRVSGVGVKWPNDLLLRGRKVAGVLVEASLRGARVEHVVAGFGVNVTRASLPTELEMSAISLEEAGAVDLGRDALLEDIVAALRVRVGAFVAGGLASQLAELRERDVARGRRVRGESVAGVAEGIDEEGRLLVRTEAGVVGVSAGEVVFEPAMRSERLPHG
jgi:BirA family biotin operon repressor/biotin-[acetyl-CoA-carboxylase] ligase